MTAEFACLALVTSLPVSLLGLLSGAPLDRAGASPRLRYAFAEATFWVVPAASVAVLLLALAPIGHFRSVLKAKLLIPSVMGPTGAATPTPEFPVASAVLLLIALVAVWRLARLALLFRRLKRLRESADGGLGRVGAIPVQLNKDVSSPLLAGLLRPTILLPIRFANPDQSRAAALVCRHEAAHAKRRDNLRVLGEEIALAVFWFNPPLRAIRDRLSSAREEVCDLAAVSGLSLDDRRLYVRTLIQCLEARAPKFPATGLIGPNRRSTTMRLEAILNPKQPPAKSALALMAAVCFAASTAAFVAVAAAQGPRGSSPLSTAPKIDITADQVVHSDPYDYIYKGRVAVRGLTEANVGLLTIDGRQARTADLALVEKAQFNTLKVTFSRNGPHPLERLDALSR